MKLFHTYFLFAVSCQIKVSARNLHFTFELTDKGTTGQKTRSTRNRLLRNNMSYWNLPLDDNWPEALLLLSSRSSDQTGVVFRAMFTCRWPPFIPNASTSCHYPQLVPVMYALGMRAVSSHRLVVSRSSTKVRAHPNPTNTGQHWCSLALSINNTPFLQPTKLPQVLTFSPLNPSTPDKRR